MQSLSQYQTKSDRTTATEALPVLCYGSYGDAVRIVQRVLYCQNYYSNVLDGFFGLRTEAAVKSFQKEKGLVADGIVNPQTWLALSQLYF